MLGQELGRQGARRRLSLNLARCASEMAEAQRLRWKVFAEEMGARLSSREPGVDHDIFDPFCEHLLVRDLASGEVVGTYRILVPSAARRVGSYYSESGFDLVRFGPLRDRLVEVGRSCVHPDYRNGATIALLWSGLAEFMQRHRYGYLMGCASMGMADGGHVAAGIYRTLKRVGESPVEYRVFPRCRLPLEALDEGIDAPLPPLIKGYRRAGAWVCGEPAWDPDFNTADVLMLLPMSRVDPRYARHFIERAAAA